MALTCQVGMLLNGTRQVGWVCRVCSSTLRRMSSKIPESRRFVDRSRILVVGGNGGSGCVSFYRDNKTQYGGPDGANGGPGGTVYVEATPQIMDLSRDRYTYTAGHGIQGKGGARIGRAGQDIIIPVPVGTVVKILEDPAAEGSSRLTVEPAKMTKIAELMEEAGSTKGPSPRKPGGHKRAKKERKKAQAKAAHEGDEDAEAGEEWEGGGEDADSELTRACDVPGGSSATGGRGNEQDWAERGAAEEGQVDERHIGARTRGKGGWNLEEESVYEYISRSQGIALEDVCEEAELTDKSNKGVYRAIADLDVEGQRFAVAVGGKGGRGNIAFSSKKDRAPKKAEVGGAGQRFRLELELKSLADIGLIGFPNAGKSSLLAAISEARPKIASYPFTTLRPHLGVIALDNYDTFTMADIPGLIEGAHDNIGLGHTFLRHVERANVLVYVLDTAGVDGRTAWKDLCILQDELDKYLPGLSRRASLIVANKMDLDTAQAGLDDLKWRLQDLEDRDGPCDLTRARVIEISCLGKMGLEEVRKTMYDLVCEKRNQKVDKVTGEPLEWQ